jgi:methyl-accepting chemotaxis protein
MTRIMARANLTYLYTQMVQGRDRIIYGVDGTVGKDHSPLRSTDTVRESEVEGIQRLMIDGTVYVSDITPWPPWGILKSAFAPIFNDQGRPVAMAGADVEAGMIRFKTRRALVITFGFGAAMLILGGVLAMVVSQKLTVPLTTIKNSALRAAAGDYTQQADVARPSELRHLAKRFTAVSTALGLEMNELKEALSVRRAARDRAGLVERLAIIPPKEPSAPPASPWAWGGLGPRQAPNAGGVILVADRAVTR